MTACGGLRLKWVRYLKFALYLYHCALRCLFDFWRDVKGTGKCAVDVNINSGMKVCVQSVCKGVQLQPRVTGKFRKHSDGEDFALKPGQLTQMIRVWFSLWLHLMPNHSHLSSRIMKRKKIVKYKYKYCQVSSRLLPSFPKPWAKQNVLKNLWISFLLLLPLGIQKCCTQKDK